MFTTVKLRQAWLWEYRLLLPVTIVLLLICSLATLLLYSRYGPMALFFSISLPAVMLFFMKNLRIGRKVSVLRGCISAQKGEVADALIYIKNKFCAGIAILRGSELILIPVSGRRSKLQFSKIKSIRPVNRLPEKDGKKLYGKQAFLVESKKHSIYGFAVASSIARRWSIFFSAQAGQVQQE